MIYIRVKLQVSVFDTTRLGIWYIFIFIYTLTLIFYGSMMQGLHGKRDDHEILKKAWVELSLESTGNHRVESWCVLLVFFFRSFVICFS